METEPQVRTYDHSLTAGRSPRCRY